VVSSDKDFVHSIEICREEFPNKRIVAVFPTMCSCDEIRNVAYTYIHVTEKEVKNSIITPEITDSFGKCIKCSDEWR
jgi:hypothetical protein